MGPRMEIELWIRRLRTQVVELSHQRKTPHLGSSLSCLDLMAVLYAEYLHIDSKNPLDPHRDRFILSKGHAVTSLYAILADRGFLSKEELQQTYAHPGSRLPEHPSRFCVPGVEASTGSLGHGLGLGVGICLGNRIQHIDADCVVLVSDGECNEGSVWESAMMAAAQHLNRLCCIVDFNKWQATGRSTEILAVEPLGDKFRACGWDVARINGHDIDAIREAFHQFREPRNRPFAIVADTIKGKGVSFMEDDNNWHYRIPNAIEVERARTELGLNHA